MIDVLKSLIVWQMASNYSGNVHNIMLIFVASYGIN